MVLESLRFQFWDPLDMVEGLIKKWKPKGCKTEKQYEVSLYDFMHSELQEVQVTKQFAKGRIRADIVVGDKVIVELKNNLDTTSKYQRLIGQLVEYEAWDGDIVILLCGKTDPNLLKDLKKYIAGKEVAFSEPIRLIEKG